MFQHSTFGNCFTFNSAINPQNENSSYVNISQTSRIGSKNGLAISMFLENDEYLGLIGQKSGANVVIHNAEEWAPLLTKSILIEAGGSTRVTIQQQSVIRESAPFSDCANDWPDFLELNEHYKRYRYTLEFCNYVCKQKTMAEVCGCTESFDRNFSTNEFIRQKAKQFCNVWNATEYACMISTYIDFYEGRRNCECPNQCSDKLFTSSISSASWPSAAFTPHFASLMTKSASKKVRKFINNLLANATYDERGTHNLQHEIKQNFARLEVNFESLTFQKITERPKYSLSNLFGTIGGNLGLWLGWSILSVMELIQWIGMTIILLLKNRRNQFEQKTTLPDR